MCRDDTISALVFASRTTAFAWVQSFTSPKLVYMNTGTANAGARGQMFESAGFVWGWK